MALAYRNMATRLGKAVIDKSHKQLRSGPFFIAASTLGSLTLRQTALGAGAVALAAGLITYKLIKERLSRTIVISKSITIQKSAHEIYAYWRKLENLPHIFQHIHQIENLDNRRSRWTINGPGRAAITWESELTVDHPDETLEWRSLTNASVTNNGAVRFSKAPQDQGTSVHVTLIYSLHGGRAGLAFAKLLGEDPNQTINEDLQRFKRFMETGELIATKPQPLSKRPAYLRLVKTIKPHS